MSVSPADPPLDRENGAVIVFALGPEFVQAATREMVERCRRHGSEPLILDAAADPLFVEHLKDPRARDHFPLLCVRGGLVGGIEVVRRLDAQRQLGPLLVPGMTQQAPRIALGRSAADELKRALIEPNQCIRLIVTEDFDHDLVVDQEKPGDVALMLDDLPMVLDAESASRADGLAIDWIDTPEGRAFRVDNPNRPEPVRFVDRAWLDREGRTRDLFVIDVRTAAEYASFHLEHARLLDATLIDTLDQLERTRPLLFYCNGGIRSRKAADRYRELGFVEIYCLNQNPVA